MDGQHRKPVLTLASEGPGPAPRLRRPRGSGRKSWQAVRPGQGSREVPWTPSCRLGCQKPQQAGSVPASVTPRSPYLPRRGPRGAGPCASSPSSSSAAASGPSWTPRGSCRQTPAGGRSEGCRGRGLRKTPPQCSHAQRAHAARPLQTDRPRNGPLRTRARPTPDASAPGPSSPIGASLLDMQSAQHTLLQTHTGSLLASPGSPGTPRTTSEAERSARALPLANRQLPPPAPPTGAHTRASLQEGCPAQGGPLRPHTRPPPPAWPSLTRPRASRSGRTPPRGGRTATDCQDRQRREKGAPRVRWHRQLAQDPCWTESSGGRAQDRLGRARGRGSRRGGAAWKQAAGGEGGR